MSLQLLAIHRESQASESISLPEGPRTIRVGRVADNDVQIDHSSISAKHALLKGSELNGVEIVDCDSSNGTFVNGIRIDRSQLHVGDIVKFAYLSYRVIDSEEVPDSKPESSAAASAQSEVLVKTAGKAEEAIREADQEIQGLVEKEQVLASEIALQKQRFEQLETEHNATLRKLEESQSRIGIQDEQIKVLQSETTKIAELERMLATRTRERDEVAVNLEKARKEAQERGAGLLERDQVIASTQFESERLSKELAKTEAKVVSLESDCLQWRDAYEALKTNLEETSASLQESLANGEAQQQRLEQFLNSFREHLGQLHQDWNYWKIGASLKDVGNLESIEDCFAEAEGLRVAIRSELDSIEPIWEKYGNRVQAELERQVADLESNIADLVSEREEKTKEVESLTEDVRGLREEVDIEVRRAQGLSRRGVQIEIPERFESMVIAQDRERQILLSLVSSLEFLEQLISGYRRSRKLREVVYELDEFAKRVIGILEANGVKEFTLEPGTELTLKHRKEVQILGKKGWGTREYGEQPFHPGTVKKVIRSGYRAGQGEGSVLLRKVEVLIREVES